MKVFIMDVARCVGCYACQIACKDEHCGNDWMPYARPQPDTGQFWGRIDESVRGNCPYVRVSYLFVPCQHCDEATCLKSCPIEGALFKREDGLVIIDPAKCNGCQSCVDACPYGSIYFNYDLNLAQKCTGCAHLLDRGGIFREPRCVDVCATGALKFGEEEDFRTIITGAEKLHPEYRLSPRFYYLNLPRKFIAGTVYTPDNEEVVVGAVCTLEGEGKTIVQTTDNWGDFWFDGLEVGTYFLKIEAAGRAKMIPDISTEKDVGLGDIALS